MTEQTPIRITDEYSLTKWNQNPTEEIPEVAEWFYDYFFKELLIIDQYHSAYHARLRMVKFVSISEKISETEAAAKVDEKINEWCTKHSIEYVNKTYTRGEDRDWVPYLNKFYFFEVPRQQKKKVDKVFQSNPGINHIND